MRCDPEAAEPAYHVVAGFAVCGAEHERVDQIDDYDNQDVSEGA